MKLEGLRYDALMMGEWRELIASTDLSAHQLLISLSDADISLLADDFYAYMLNDDDAVLFLSSEQVNARLHHTLAAWIKSVLCSSTADLPALISAQRKVG